MLIAVSNIYNEVRYIYIYIYISEVKRMAVSSEVNLDAKDLPGGLLRDRGEGMLKLQIDRCITTS